MSRVSAAEARRMLEQAGKATPGPWTRDTDGAIRSTRTDDDDWLPAPQVIHASRYPGEEGQTFATEEDYAFIVSARADVPALAETVIALEAERDGARADLDVLSRAVGQALVAASLQAGETLADPIPHAIVSTVTRLRAEALGQRAEIARLRAEIERPKTGDLVTPENVASLPVGTVVRWGRWHAARTGPDRWVGDDGDDNYADEEIAYPDPPTYIVSIPTGSEPSQPNGET